MNLTNEFQEFLKEIRPTASQNEAAKNGHNLLRSQLLADPHLKPLIITTFLQGSYRRSTVVRPQKDENVDVDLVVVGDFDHNWAPKTVLELFEPFAERHYPGQWERQGRSIGIKKSRVDLDLVITRQPPDALREALAFSDPLFNPNNQLSTAMEKLRDGTTTLEEIYQSDSETIAFAEEAKEIAKSRKILEAQGAIEGWMENPLEIPDRDTQKWEKTHPLAQIEWTRLKNIQTDGQFINIVRAIKWWKNTSAVLPKYPKSYPLEHMIGDCCPDRSMSLAEGITLTLEEIASRYGPSARAGIVPTLKDRGCDVANVMERVAPNDFKSFIVGVEQAASTARVALDSEDPSESSEGWKELFGSKFPTVKPSDQDAKKKVAAGVAVTTGGFAQPAMAADPSEGRFA